MGVHKPIIKTYNGRAQAHHKLVQQSYSSPSQPHLIGAGAHKPGTATDEVCHTCFGQDGMQMPSSAPISGGLQFHGLQLGTTWCTGCLWQAAHAQPEAWTFQHASGV